MTERERILRIFEATDKKGTPLLLSMLYSMLNAWKPQHLNGWTEQNDVGA